MAHARTKAYAECSNKHVLKKQLLILRDSASPSAFGAFHARSQIASYAGGQAPAAAAAAAGQTGFSAAARRPKKGDSEMLPASVPPSVPRRLHPGRCIHPRRRRRRLQSQSQCLQLQRSLARSLAVSTLSIAQTNRACEEGRAGAPCEVWTKTAG